MIVRHRGGGENLGAALPKGTSSSGQRVGSVSGVDKAGYDEFVVLRGQVRSAYEVGRPTTSGTTPPRERQLSVRGRGRGGALQGVGVRGQAAYIIRRTECGR